MPKYEVTLVYQVYLNVMDEEGAPRESSLEEYINHMLKRASGFEVHADGKAVLSEPEYKNLVSISGSTACLLYQVTAVVETEAASPEDAVCLAKQAAGCLEVRGEPEWVFPAPVEYSHVSCVKTGGRAVLAGLFGETAEDRVEDILNALTDGEKEAAYADIQCDYIIRDIRQELKRQMLLETYGPDVITAAVEAVYGSRYDKQASYGENIKRLAAQIIAGA